MTKQDVYNLLKEQQIAHEITEHPAVYNMEEVARLVLPYPDRDAKNLFVRDDKRRNYYLITVRGDKRVNLKDFRRKQGTKPLTFASPEELLDLMGLIPGAVTPFGLLNDREHRIHFYIDRDFWQESGLIGVHPNDNTATVWLKAEDLARLLQEHGVTVDIVELDEPGR